MVAEGEGRRGECPLSGIRRISRPFVCSGFSPISEIYIYAYSFIIRRVKFLRKPDRFWRHRVYSGRSAVIEMTYDVMHHIILLSAPASRRRRRVARRGDRQHELLLTWSSVAAAAAAY